MTTEPIHPAAAAEDALDRILEVAELRSAALWLLDGRGRLGRIAARPRGINARDFVSVDDARIERMLAAPTFNWTVNTAPVGVPECEDRLSTYVSFALDGRLLLEVCVAGAAREMASGVASIHSELAAFLTTVPAPDQQAWASEDVPAIIDLEYVRTSAMGDRGFVREILGIAAGELRNGLEAIRTSAGRGDRVDVRAAAHRIRSTARTVGAAGLDGRLGLLESACDDGRAIDVTVVEALQCGEEVLAALRGVIGSVQDAQTRRR